VGISVILDVGAASSSGVTGTDLNSIGCKCSNSPITMGTEGISESTVNVEEGIVVASMAEGLQSGALKRGGAVPGWLHSFQHLVSVSTKAYRT
jgi:hypothetical protein